MGFRFQLINNDVESEARLGLIETPHGVIKTPVFMPVGTKGTVKALTPQQLQELGVEVILSNTYHLYLRPGQEIIRNLGGLHRFLNWPGPILTDSGGYQIYSLAALRKITTQGAIFQSHIDGSRHLLTPELAIRVQEDLGADIIMCLDDCTPYPASFAETEESLQMTMQWAKRCLEAKVSERQALFGIVQGGMYPELRKRAAQELTGLNFDGYALGGLSVGEPKEHLKMCVESVVPLLPAGKPRYLMGVGLPEDLVEAVSQGIDMFDCVLPTRSARNGLLFTNRENIVIKHAIYREDSAPVDDSCDCYTCRNFSRAYLRHLFMAKEILAMILNTVHNIRYFMRLMEEIREAIRTDSFGEFKKVFLNMRKPAEENRP